MARLSGNAILNDWLRRLVSRTTLLIAGVEAPGQNACSFEDHQNILFKLESSDKVGALKCMALHLQACSHRSTLSAAKSFDLRSVLNRT
jgi:DNA-binding GntR family transcriptional regulator